MDPQYITLHDLLSAKMENVEQKEFERAQERDELSRAICLQLALNATFTTSAEEAIEAAQKFYTYVRSMPSES